MPSFFRYNIVIDLVGVSVVGLIMIGLRREREHNSDYKTVYRALTHCLLAVLCLDIPAWVLDGSAFLWTRPVLCILNILYYVMQITFCYLWLIFSMQWNGIPENIVRRFKGLLSVPLIVEILFILSSPFNGFVFFIDAENVYSRGRFYYLNLIPYAFYVGGSLALRTSTTSQLTASP